MSEMEKGEEGGRDERDGKDAVEKDEPAVVPGGVKLWIKLKGLGRQGKIGGSVVLLSILGNGWGARKQDTARGWPRVRAACVQG